MDMAIAWIYKIIFAKQLSLKPKNGLQLLCFLDEHG